MGDVRMWIVVMWVVVLLIAFVRYARGPEHHHGDDVGAWRPPISRVAGI